MEDGSVQRVAIKLCFKGCISVTETLVSAQKAYGNEPLKQSNALRWYSRFRDGMELVEDDERGDRAKSTGTVVNMLLLLIWSKITVESHQE